MAARNPLVEAPPYAVEQTLKRLGANLRTARLRRKLTIAETAEKIGTGPRAVQDAEKGKPTTGIAVFAALLWTFDLLGQLDAVADPARDERGLVLDAAHSAKRARKKGQLDNDF
jgi:transcriptional regulator with XRE-family HTH domain